MKPTLFAAALALCAGRHSAPGPARARLHHRCRGKTVRWPTTGQARPVLEWVNPGCLTWRHDKALQQRNAETPWPKAWSRRLIRRRRTASDYKDAGRDGASGCKTRRPPPRPPLMDSDGKVGRSYGCAHDAHMYIVNPVGTLVYARRHRQQSRRRTRPTSPAPPHHVKVASGRVAGRQGGRYAVDAGLWLLGEVIRRCRLPVPRPSVRATAGADRPPQCLEGGGIDLAIEFFARIAATASAWRAASAASRNSSRQRRASTPRHRGHSSARPKPHHGLAEAAPGPIRVAPQPTAVPRAACAAAVPSLPYRCSPGGSASGGRVRPPPSGMSRHAARATGQQARDMRGPAVLGAIDR